ncbi:hypothetical protein WME76_41835 [Sorangium sp. So ce119]|uniref:hypothetical protein n=1 Tax=Sorangium sp. So ce119 TaxID=3133279 RepID=UPI003F5E60ED
MNVTSKLDLDGMLNDWPAPALDEAAWETRAARIVEVALSGAPEARAPEDAAAQTDLLAAPDLAAEPGEEQAGDILREVHAAGDSTMADGSQAGRAAKSEASLSGGSSSRPPERKRQSLKEIAERASQAPGRVSGVPGAGGSPLSTPLPSGRSALSTPLPSSGRGSMPPGRGSIPSGIRASSPSLRSSEGVTEDSGVIDLNRLSASVPPEQVEAGGEAQPGAADTLDEKPAEVAALSARRPRAPAASGAEASAKKRSGGMIAGAAVAALGLAAAVAVMVRTPAAPSQETTAAASTPAVTQAAPRDEKAVEPAAPVAAAPAAPAATTEVEQPPAGAEEKLAAAPKTPAAPAGAGAAAPGAPEAPAAPAAAPKTEPQSKVAAAPTVAGNPGDLPSAMQAAVGDSGDKQPSVESEAPVPASGPLRQQNVPEQPSQGSVQAALGSVMGNARACVAGADDVSRAQITFSSTGQVSKVNVSGWAAANGQSSCVQSALKAANVGPFSKPSFSVSATIRP